MKLNRFLLQALVLVIILTSVCTSAYATDLSNANLRTATPYFTDDEVEEYLEKLPTPSEISDYNKDGTPIYDAQWMTDADGNYVYGVCVPLGSTSVVKGNARLTLEIPNVAFYTVHRIGGGHTLEVTVDVWILTQPVKVVVNGMGADGVLGKKTYNASLVGYGTGVFPHIAVTHNFTGFNPYITTGIQTFDVGNFTVSGVVGTAWYAQHSFNVDISEL